MKWLPIASLLSLFLAVPCMAQAPNQRAPQNVPPTAPKSTLAISPGELSATPEMWFYEQSMRQYQDPKAAVRQKAEYRAAERQRRLTSLKWYGMSNTRPQANGDPVHGDYSPSWTSGSTAYPMRWSSTQGATIIANSNNGTTVR